MITMRKDHNSRKQIVADQNTEIIKLRSEIKKLESKVTENEVFYSIRYYDICLGSNETKRSKVE
jgi:hypothetical protein